MGGSFIHAFFYLQGQLSYKKIGRKPIKRLLSIKLLQGNISTQNFLKGIDYSFITKLFFLGPDPTLFSLLVVILQAPSLLKLTSLLAHKLSNLKLFKLNLPRIRHPGPLG